MVRKDLLFRAREGSLDRLDYPPKLSRRASVGGPLSILLLWSRSSESMLETR